jgi:hypothetical protein
MYTIHFAHLKNEKEWIFYGACFLYSTPCSFSYVNRHYNSLWVLAFSVILFHSALSLHWFLHRLIPHYLHIFFDIYNPSIPWSTSNSRTYRFPL